MEGKREGGNKGRERREGEEGGRGGREREREGEEGSKGGKEKREREEGGKKARKREREARREAMDAHYHTCCSSVKNCRDSSNTRYSLPVRKVNTRTCRHYKTC